MPAFILPQIACEATVYFIGIAYNVLEQKIENSDGYGASQYLPIQWYMEKLRLNIYRARQIVVSQDTAIMYF